MAAALPDQYAEWKIIVLFYSALHYVEAFLVTKVTVYRDHTLRNTEMRRHEETKAIYSAYERLKKAAHEARYDGTPFRPTDVPTFADLHARVREAMKRALP